MEERWLLIYARMLFSILWKALVTAPTSSSRSDAATSTLKSPSATRQAARASAPRGLIMARTSTDAKNSASALTAMIRIMQVCSRVFMTSSSSW